jgi:putative transposase
VTELVESGLELEVAIKAMMLTRSSYYYNQESKKDNRKRPLDDQLVQKLNDLADYELVYGYRKITKSFNEYNHKKVYRHMKALKILQPKKLKKRALTRLAIECPIKSNVRWEGDLSYVWDGSKMNYLFAIVDVFDKEPLGDYYGLRCRAEEAIYSLEEAVKARFGNLIPTEKYRVTLRVDQGSQYISKKFKKRAKQLGVKLEYCGINCPNDKPYIESFFSRYKCEEVYRNEYSSFTEGFLGWVQFKHWYKNERIHQGLGWLTIPEFKLRGSHLADKVLS